MTTITSEPQAPPFDVADLVERVYQFVLIFSGVELFPYQEAFSKRLIGSVLAGDGEELTGCWSRQSGKSEVLADTIVGLMVIIPKLANIFPEQLGKFKRGFWVGTFAPVEDQANTLFSRVVTRLTDDRALDMMLDPEIDDAPAKGTEGGRFLRLKRSGSFVRMQTANPKAKIESKTYHLIVVDEAQGAEEYVVKKSINPMGAFTNATRVLIGTPDIVKGNFYHAIQRNKRQDSSRRKKNHYEYDWTYCARYNSDYRKYVQGEKERLGEDSDEFRLSYQLEWLLERGMFVPSQLMEELGDKSTGVILSHWTSPVIVGIDVARKLDSTVVTAVAVDWDHPDEFGYFPHFILNWLEIHGDNWESQYFQVVDFLSNYNCLAVAVDGQGIGDAFADRMKVLMPGTDVRAPGSMASDQSDRWKHLMQLLQRKKISWPARSDAKRLARWKRFDIQMRDLEKIYKGPHLLAAAPDETEAHDDYPDSLALACSLTHDFVMPTIEVSESPFVTRRRAQRRSK